MFSGRRFAPRRARGEPLDRLLARMRLAVRGRDEGQVLAEQHCVHGRVTGALKRDDAAMDVGLQLAARCEIAKPSAMIFPELRIVPSVPI